MKQRSQKSPKINDYYSHYFNYKCLLHYSSGYPTMPLQSQRPIPPYYDY